MSADPNSPYSRKNPFRARISVNRRLTAEGSNKDTRHFEIDLAGSGLAYEVGDSLGVFPKNDPELVDAILTRLGLSGHEEVTAPDGTAVAIREAMVGHFVITEPSKQLLQALAEKDSSAEHIPELLEPGAKPHLDNFLWGRDILDLLREFPEAQFTADEFAKTLRKLQPRLYSIASSQRAAGERVDLTVAIVRYTPNGKTRARKGVCSTFLAERAEDGVPVFVHQAKHFRLPEDPAAPCIMVGPGTGIAPFRAFLQDRAATAAPGRNWLVFGEQHAATDFFYKEEFEAHLASGVLTKLTTAFSRDQDHKIYVQHRIAEHAAEIFQWLEDGAYFYVCGDAKNMAKDVDAALQKAVESAGGLTPEQAREYIDQLKKARRYRKDVY